MDSQLGVEELKKLTRHCFKRISTFRIPLEEKQDVVQDAIISTYRHREKLANYEEFEKYAGRVAFNEALRQVRQPLVTRLEEGLVEPSFRELQFEGEQGASLEKQLQKLNLEERRVAQLYFGEEETVAEIAVTCNVSEQMVVRILGRLKKRWQRARENF